MVKRAIEKITAMGFEFDWKIPIPSLAFGAAMILGAYFALKSDIRDQDTRLKFVERQIADHKDDAKSIRAIEKTISRIEGDVSWMRTIIEKRSNLGMPNPFDPAPLSTRTSNQGG